MKPRTRPLPASQRHIPAENQPFRQSGQFLARYKGQTMKSYRTGLRVFADWLQIHSGYYSLMNHWPLSPQGITNKMVLDFKLWLAESGMKSPLYAIAVKQFLSYLDLIDERPAGVQLSKLDELLKNRRRSDRNKRMANMYEAIQDIPKIVQFFDDQVLALKYGHKNSQPALEQLLRRYEAQPGAVTKLNEAFKAASGTGKFAAARRLTMLRNRALLNALFFSAARIGEIAALQADQLSKGQNVATVIGKGDKVRTLYFDELCTVAIGEYLDALDGYLAQYPDRTVEAGGGLWLSIGKGRKCLSRLQSHGLYQLIKFAVKDLGLNPKLAAHDFRRYRLNSMLSGAKGLPIEQVKEIAGHESIDTTLIYVHIQDETLQRAIFGRGRD